MLLYAFVCACGFLRLHSLGMYVCTYIHIYVDACTCYRVCMYYIYVRLREPFFLFLLFLFPFFAFEISISLAL